MAAPSRNVRGFAAPLALFAAPLLLRHLSLGIMASRSATGAWVHDVPPIPLFVGRTLDVTFARVLALVVLAQVFFTLARLASIDRLAPRRAAMGKAFFYGLTILFVTFASAGPMWRLATHYPGASPLEATLLHVAVEVVTAFVAFETSRRGEWSGIVALAAGLSFASTVEAARKTFERDLSLGPHLALFAVLCVALYMLTVIVLRAVYGRERVAADPRVYLRRRDASLIPLVVAGFASGLFETVSIAASLETYRFELREVLSALRPFLILGAVVLVRVVDPTDEDLARGGLGALFKPAELALVPHAVAWLLHDFVSVRLTVAAHGDDAILSASSARSLSDTVVLRVVLYGTWVLVLAALGPYLRWIRSLPREAES